MRFTLFEFLSYVWNNPVRYLVGLLFGALLTALLMWVGKRFNRTR